MSLFKLVGLTVLTGIVGLALLGVGSASATNLCTEAPSGSPLKCKAGTALSFAIVVGVAKSSSLTSEAGSIECEGTGFGAGLTQEGEAVSGLSELAFGEENGKKGCKSKVPSCGTALEVDGVGSFTTVIAYVGTGSPNGEVKVTKPRVSIQLDCGALGKPKCLYGNESTVGSFFNSTQEVTYTKAAFKRIEGSALCPATGNFSAAFKVELLEGKLIGGGAVKGGGVFVAA
jgi:hypothetical protein